MLESRIDRQGRVLHNGPHGTYSVGRPDQCEYDGCKGYRESRSRHCWKHTRR